MSLDDSDPEVTEQHVPEEERTRPSDCVLAQETTHGSSSSNLDLQMKLMEKRLGSVELLDRDKPAKYLVAEAIDELDCHLQYSADKKTSIFIPIIKAGLSNYCTLQEMKTLMLRTVKHYFTSLFDDDKLGLQVYSVRSLYRESVRRNEAEQEATANEVVAKAVKYLEVALESKTLTNQTIRDGMQGMITCLSNFYTLEKMLEYMTSSTGLTAKQAEQLFNRHIGNDELKREAYLKKAAMSAGIHAQAAEPAKGDHPVAEIIKGLECDLKALPNQKIQVIFQSLKTCLSEYYTVEEMQSHMSAAVEQYFTSLFGDEELGHKAYLEKSLRYEAARRHEAEADSKVQTPLSQSDEEAMAYKLVSSVVKDLEGYIDTTDGQQSRSMMECMITCLESFYTMDEMKTYMSPRTILKASAVEQWYIKELSQRDEHEAYLAVSQRMEAMRSQQQQSTSDAVDAKPPSYYLHRK